jgi:hypothetical protein
VPPAGSPSRPREGRHPQPFRRDRPHRRKAYGFGIFLALFALCAGIRNDTGNVIFIIVQAALARLAGRRVKDLGWRPWWARANYHESAMRHVDRRRRRLERHHGRTVIHRVLLLAFYVAAPVIIVVLAGFPAGNAGPNRFGPPPNEKGALDAATTLFE